MARWLSSRARVIPTYAIARDARSDSTVQHTPGVRSIADGHALGGVHGGGVAQGEVLAAVVALEDDPGAVGEPFGGDLPGVGVDPGDPPAVAVADLVDAVSAPMLGSGCDLDAGVVVAAQDDVTDAHLVITRGRHGGRVRVAAVVVVQFLVDRVGDLPAVTDDRGVFAVARGR